MAASQVARKDGSAHIMQFPKYGVLFALLGWTFVSMNVTVHLKVGFRFVSLPKYHIMSSTFQEPNFVEHCNFFFNNWNSGLYKIFYRFIFVITQFCLRKLESEGFEVLHFRISELKFSRNWKSFILNVFPILWKRW